MKRLTLLATSTAAVALTFAASAHGIDVPAGHSHAAETKTPIKHFITLLQENHSYDNYFGTYPRGDGLPPGVCMPVQPTRSEPCIRPFHIGDTDVEPRDLDHSGITHRLQWNNGRMDGFVHALNLRNQDGRLAMGYYDERDLPYYWNLADEYVLYDRFFTSASAGSFLNHVYWVTARSVGGDRIATEGLNVGTIFDELERRGISWKFYVSNYEPRLTYRTLERYPGNRAAQVAYAPLLSIPRFLDNPRLNRHIVDLEEYFRDVEGDTLPAVSFMAPSGPSEHPPSSVRSGQAFVRSLINALIRSPEWKHSAFLLAYDDWGGWYDHVNPPQVDKHGYGFRVPAILVGPYARHGYIDSTVLDFTSILKFIEENWGVKPLAARDRKANSIASGFDFSQPPRSPQFTSGERGTSGQASVRRAWIYVLYGGALFLPALLIGSAARRARRSVGDEATSSEGGSG